MMFKLIIGALVLLASVVFLYRYTMGSKGQQRDRGRSIRMRARWRLKPGRGFAPWYELLSSWGSVAAMRHGKRGRPDLSLIGRLLSSPHDYAVYLGRIHWFRRAWAKIEDAMLIISAPRTGKSGYAGSMIIRHPGPVLATSTRHDLESATKKYRASMSGGKVWTFSPQDGQSNFSWNPIPGCELPEIAMRRAAALCGEAEPGEDGMWVTLATSLIAAWLHAAALLGASLSDCMAWNNRDGDDKALAMLRSIDARPGDSKGRQQAIEGMASVIHQAMDKGRTASSIRTTAGTYLNWLASPMMADAVNDSPQSFSFSEWLEGNGTLYLVASETGGDSLVSPLFRMLVSEVHYKCRQVANTRKGNKLRRPALFLLDELCQCCDIPAASWSSDSSGYGIRLVMVAHSLAQLSDRYGENQMKTIWNNSTCKLLLGSITEVGTLAAVSELIGDIVVKSGKEGTREVPMIPVDAIRRVPDKWALVLRTNLSPVISRLPMHWELSQRRAMKLVAARAPGAEARTVTPAAVAPVVAGPPFPLFGAELADSALAATVAKWDEGSL